MNSLQNQVILILKIRILFNNLQNQVNLILIENKIIIQQFAKPGESGFDWK